MNFFRILTANHGEFRYKNSNFLAFAHPIQSLDEYKSRLQGYKLNYSKASHVCSAYRLYLNGKLEEYASDDGEPRGSSGPPILRIIKRHEIINGAVYVVRYFGGTKLGVSGLISSYSAGAESALFEISKFPWKPTIVLSIQHGYEYSQIVGNVVLKFQGKIINQDFGEVIETNIELDERMKVEFEKYLSEKSNGILSVKN